MLSADIAHAADYSVYMGRMSTNYGTTHYAVSSIDIIGYNETQGHAKNIPANGSFNYGSRDCDWYLNYTLPDDGSYWRVQGNVVLLVSTASVGGETSFTYQLYKIDLGNSTSGSFTGYSPRTATDSANTAATNAANASTAANTAATNASNAYTAASNAANYTWDNLTLKSAATLAREARDNAANANTKIDNLTTAITNIQMGLNSDVTPPTARIKTVSGAVATSGSSIMAVVDVSDNQSATFTYSLDNVVYTPLPGNGVINLPVNNPGPNLITVWVKDERGNASKCSIVVRKL